MPGMMARARRYAYHFFFNRMIPLAFIEPHAGNSIYRLEAEQRASSSSRRVRRIGYHLQRNSRADAVRPRPEPSSRASELVGP